MIYLTDQDLKEIYHDCKKEYKKLFLADRGRNISNGKRDMGVLCVPAQGSEQGQVPSHSLIHT